MIFSAEAAVGFEGGHAQRSFFGRPSGGQLFKAQNSSQARRKQRVGCREAGCLKGLRSELQDMVGFVCKSSFLGSKSEHWFEAWGISNISVGF